MAAEITTSPELAVVSTALLFSDPNLSGYPVEVTYDVSADGRFVLVEDVPGDTPRGPRINVVENWYEEFRTERSESN